MQFIIDFQNLQQMWNISKNSCKLRKFKASEKKFNDVEILTLNVVLLVK